MSTVCITLTSPFVLNAFLLGHIAVLSRTFHVVICINTRESAIPVQLPPGVECRHVEIRRAISPFYDISALVKLWRLYRHAQFAAVISVTPKAGLLGMLAARWAGIPVRVHWFTGQVWATRSGFGRWLLKQMDRVLARSASFLLADSASQREFLVGEGVAQREKIEVIGHGSISGVNLKRFHSDTQARQMIRSELGMASDEICFIYVGRVKREKGIVELLKAFSVLKAENSEVQLLLVGPDEEGLVPGSQRAGLHRFGYTQDVERYMATADVICLPSHREGFGTVLIEGAAVGLPAIASRIYGITDAVVDGETGLLHEPGDVDDLLRCMRAMLQNSALRLRLSGNAVKRARQLFSSKRLEELFAKWVASKINDR